MSKKNILTVSLTILLILFISFKISKSRNFQFFGQITSHVSTNQKIIALTFDDAPSKYSNIVVDILTKENVPATFYIIGKNISDFPNETKYIISHGHQVGNHSYSHQRFLFKSLKFIDNEIQKTNQLIINSGYTGEITFRPPNGKKFLLLPWYLSQHHIETIMWNLEPDTYASKNKDSLIKYTLENVKPGSIILLHPFCNEDCQTDRDALPEIINQLKSQGYTFVTVSELQKLY